MKKNILDEEVMQEMVERIEKITPEQVRQWGTMNVDEMLCHCKLPLQAAIKEKTFSPTGNPVAAKFIIFLIVNVLERFKPGLPTTPEFDKNHSDLNTTTLEKDKTELIELVRKFYAFPSVEEFGPHPFFRSMKRRSWGRLSYMHLDHHLRQFSA